MMILIGFYWKKSMGDSRYKVVIVGAGKIGAFFDCPGSNAVLTHAHAFSSHPRFELAGFVDRDAGRARKAAAIWGGRAGKLEEFLRDGVDIVSLAVPDNLHYQYLKQLADAPLKLIFTEKPLAGTLKQAKELLGQYQKNNLPVCVNYRRRFVPEFKELAQNARSGKFGKLLAGTGYYGKGLLHNGSHLIDLLHFMGEEVSGCRIFNIDRDHFKDDPSISAGLSLKSGGSFILEAVDSRKYTIFEMDLLFEKCRIRIKDSGFNLEFHKIVADKLFAGYRNMSEVKEYPTKLARSLSYAVDDLSAFLRNGRRLECSLRDGYQAMQACELIQKEGRICRSER
jgi:predicted dehydrogenase